MNSEEILDEEGEIHGWTLGNFYGIANLGEICKFVLIYGNPPKFWFHKHQGWQIIFQVT